MKNFHKICALITIAMVALTAQAFTSVKGSKVILMVYVEVQNFADWKKGFDAGAAAREKAGIKVITICRAANNGNNITIVEEAENAQAAYEFVTMLKAKQRPLGLSKLEITLFDKVE